jgi:sigma-B regulation protein RsbU (phosphoserine phosphatase)
MSVSWRPASTVGGDCYDAQLLNGHLIVTVGEVSGKGLPAALLMSHLQALVRASAEQHHAEPERLASNVNRFLYGNTTETMFVTNFFCELSLERRSIRYCNAGHPAPILVRAGGECERLSTGGVPLAMFETASYERGEAQLAEGDRLILFTDGVVESTSPAGEEFGDARLTETARSCRSGSAQAIVDEVMQVVSRFNGNIFEDDATLLCLAV